MVEEIKSRSAEYANANDFQTEGTQKRSKANPGVVLEAEYRVLNDEKNQ